MELKPGTYEILTTGHTRVGRAENETKESGPKKVFANTDDPHPTWVVERLPNGNYYLFVRGAPTGAEDGHVVAQLLHRELKIEWHLEEHHSGLLRIKDTKNGHFWTVPSFDKLEALVELKPLEHGESDKQSFKLVHLE